MSRARRDSVHAARPIPEVPWFLSARGGALAAEARHAAPGQAQHDVHLLAAEAAELEGALLARAGRNVRLTLFGHGGLLRSILSISPAPTLGHDASGPSVSCYYSTRRRS